MAIRILVAISLVCALVSTARGANENKIPGMQTAASTGQRLATYLGQGGPIQPGVDAISTVPSQVGEQVNSGLAQLSSGLGQGVQRLSQAAGENGHFMVPGLDGQAPVDVAAQHTVRVRSVRSPLESASQGGQNMLNSAKDSLSSLSSQLQSQAQQQLGTGSLPGLEGIQGLGRRLLGQAQDISGIMSSGLRGALGELHKAGQGVISNLQTNHPQNMEALGQAAGPLARPLQDIHSNLQKLQNSALPDMQGLNGLPQQARQFGNTIQQLGGQTRDTAQGAATQLGTQADRARQGLQQAIASLGPS